MQATDNYQACSDNYDAHEKLPTTATNSKTRFSEPGLREICTLIYTIIVHRPSYRSRCSMASRECEVRRIAAAPSVVTVVAHHGVGASKRFMGEVVKFSGKTVPSYTRQAGQRTLSAAKELSAELLQLKHQAANGEESQ